MFALTKPASAIFRLYANCILQKGYKNYLICDLQRQQLRHIPPTLYFILSRYKDRPADYIKEQFEHQHDDMIDGYFKFLCDNDLGFYCSSEELKLFPELELSFDYPSGITNAVIDLSKNSPFRLKDAFWELALLHCRHVQLRFAEGFSVTEIASLISSTEKHALDSIELVIAYYPSISKTELDELYAQRFVSAIHVYNVPAGKQHALKERGVKDRVFVHRHNIVEKPVTPDLSKLKINITLFCESQKHHTYFNRKLYIGNNGQIKNAPECLETFGTINDDRNLSEVITGEAFQRYWHVRKKHTDICKQCEFMHLCIDGRIPHQRPSGEWYHETECSYNPFIGKWKSESGYKTLAESGITSNAEGFKINYRKLNKINNYG